MCFYAFKTTLVPEWSVLIAGIISVSDKRS